MYQDTGAREWPDGDRKITIACAFGSIPTVTVNAPRADVLVVDDHIGSDLDNPKEQLEVEEILRSKLDGNMLIFDYAEYNPISPALDGVKIGSARWQTLQTIIEFNALHKRLETPPTNKRAAFNFCINKLRPGRSELLKALQALGPENLTYEYSLCYAVSCHMHGFEPKFYNPTLKAEFLIDRIQNNLPNAITYNDYLKDAVFEPTYISFITEPMSYQNSTFYSEKTFFAFESFTMPIWFGGYKIPSYLRKMGFDLFDDLIDHSYGDLEDPNERMQKAIQLNKHLLFDLDRLERFYVDNIDRFWHNYNLNRDFDFQLEYVRKSLEDSGISDGAINYAFGTLVHNYYDVLSNMLNREIPNERRNNPTR